MSRKDTPQGADNVLLDLGFDDAEELSAKAALALKLNELILLWFKKTGSFQEVEMMSVKPTENKVAALFMRLM